MKIDKTTRFRNFVKEPSFVKENKKLTQIQNKQKKKHFEQV